MVSNFEFNGSTPQILTNQTVQEDLDFVMVFAAMWYLVLVWRWTWVVLGLEEV